jgi:hypothetical protein
MLASSFCQVIKKPTAAAAVRAPKLCFCVRHNSVSLAIPEIFRFGACAVRPEYGVWPIQIHCILYLPIETTSVFSTKAWWLSYFCFISL